MLQVDDINRYVIKQSLMGNLPFYAKKLNDTLEIEFLQVPEDIQYVLHVNKEININYKVQKDDYLNISVKSNIIPLKKSDFDKFYTRVPVKRTNINIDF